MIKREQPTTKRAENDASIFQIGVNYWPQRKTIRMWRDFDPGELREDLDRLREWNFSPIRIFLRWEDFQPDRDRINTNVLHRLSTLADWSADRQLSLWICLFAGHIHRANWLPYWMVSHESHQGEPFTLVEGFQVSAKPKWPLSDPRLMQAQHHFIKEIIAVLHNHPALWAYDLGERLTSLYESVPCDLWRRWLSEMLEEIRRWDSKTPVTLGLQPIDLLKIEGLDPRTAAEVCDFLSISCLGRETPWGRGYLDPVAGLYLTELTSVLADGKPVWASAVGLANTIGNAKNRGSLGEPIHLLTSERKPDQPAREAEAEEYARLSMECLRRNGIPGALWWCYSDYPYVRSQAPFVDFPLEASYGLVGEGWRPKRVLSGIEAVDRTCIRQRPDMHWMDVEPEQYWKAPRKHIQRLYERFRDQIPLSKY